MKLDPFDIFLPPILSCVFAALVWLSDRTITGGRPLTPHMKKVLFYSFFFVLGMGYSMAIVAMLGWPRPFWIVFTVAWALLLASIAWWRYRRSQSQTAPETPRRPVSALLAEGIPALGLLICVIAGAVEWEYIFERQGRWWVGVLWLAGIAASILAARQNRRTTVIVVLRGVVGLLIIGAIAQRTPPALVAAVVFGLALLLLEKFWHSNPNDRDQVLGNSTGRG
jgi:hypothetical protein